MKTTSGRKVGFCYHTDIPVFSSAHRLRKTTDIARVLRSKLGAFDNVCGIKVAKNSLDVSRFAVVVGTKVSKRAVVRNRLRRQYREMIKRRLGHIRPGFDVMLLVSKPALELPFDERELRLERTLTRAKLL